MSWQRLSRLALDPQHTHAAHYRWGLTCFSPRFAQSVKENRQYHALVARFIQQGCREEAARERARSTCDNLGIDQDWIADQCGGCAFYVPLEGALGSDWGACTCAESPHDGRLMFEHDGCRHFAHEGEPDAAAAERYREHLERQRRFAADELQELKTEARR